MRRVLLPDGRSFEGSPLEIVRKMKSIAFFVEKMTLAEYTEWVARNIVDLHGLELRVSGDTDEARATSLLEQLITYGMAVDLEAAS